MLMNEVKVSDTVYDVSHAVVLIAIISAVNNDILQQMANVVFILNAMGFRTVCNRVAKATRNELDGGVGILRAYGLTGRSVQTGLLRRMNRREMRK